MKKNLIVGIAFGTMSTFSWRCIRFCYDLVLQRR